MLGKKKLQMHKNLIILLNKIIINIGKPILKIGNTVWGEIYKFLSLKKQIKNIC